ncbi:hypothetical protein QJQ45_019120 [Haematococcus lacustris]|nr:hypothetical protein QJQ45_019120 [Haematococcus lacustris]
MAQQSKRRSDHLANHVINITQHADDEARALLSTSTVAESEGPRICRFCLEEEEDTAASAAVLGPSTSEAALRFRWLRATTHAAHASPAQNDNPLIVPCLCTGTAKYVHRQCLEKWREATPAAFYKCTVCGYEYQFERLDWAWVLRSPLTPPTLFVLLLFCLVCLLGFLPSFRPAHGTFGDHLLNGFVVVGLAGFGLTIADAFSFRRALALLSLLGGGEQVGQAAACIVFSLFQCAAVAVMVTCLALSSMTPWGVLLLAVAGMNHLSCGPLLRWLHEACLTLSSRLEMNASRMIVREVVHPPPGQQLPACQPGQQQGQQQRGHRQEQGQEEQQGQRVGQQEQQQEQQRQQQDQEHVPLLSACALSHQQQAVPGPAQEQREQEQLPQLLQQIQQPQTHGDSQQGMGMCGCSSRLTEKLATASSLPDHSDTAPAATAHDTSLPLRVPTSPQNPTSVDGLPQAAVLIPLAPVAPTLGAADSGLARPPQEAVAAAAQPPSEVTAPPSSEEAAPRPSDSAPPARHSDDQPRPQPAEAPPRDPRKHEQTT